MKHSSPKVLIGFLLTFAVIAITGIVVKAAEDKPSGLSISPLTVELSITPGQTSAQIIKLENPLAVPVTLFPLSANFSAKDDSGTPTFDYTKGEKIAGLSDWMEFSKDAIVIPPKGRTEFSYKINIPADAEPGGHYGAMFFSSEPGSTPTDSGVSLSGQVGQLVLVKFGTTTETASISEFSALKFSQKTPIELITKIENTGNVHIRSTGNIIIKNMLGKNVATLTVNETNSSVMPKQIRKFTNSWDNKWAFGRYTASTALVYGSKSLPLTAQATFWIIPIIPLLIVLAIIIIIILLIRWMMKRHDAGVRKQLNNSTQPVVSNPPTPTNNPEGPTNPTR